MRNKKCRLSFWHVKACQKGMSLIEVLVSMLIIGLALAMSISMIQASNRFGESAEFGSSALQQTQAIIDKVKSNKIAMNTYVFDKSPLRIRNDGVFIDAYQDVISVPIADIPNYLKCQSTTCTNSENIAIADVVQWNNTLQEMLPGGRGIIRRLPVAGRDFFEVVVMWNHNPEADMSNNQLVNGIRVNFSL